MLRTRFITANGNLPVIAPFISQGEDFNTRPYKRSDRSLTASFFLSAFSPRSYARSDAAVSSPSSVQTTISIHAPTQGATAKLHRNYKLPLYKLYNIFKMTQYLILLIIKKITNLPVILPKIRCECTGVLMFTPHSHLFKPEL